MPAPFIRTPSRSRFNRPRKTNETVSANAMSLHERERDTRHTHTFARHTIKCYSLDTCRAPSREPRGPGGRLPPREAAAPGPAVARSVERTGARVRLRRPPPPPWWVVASRLPSEAGGRDPRQRWPSAAPAAAAPTPGQYVQPPGACFASTRYRRLSAIRTSERTLLASPLWIFIHSKKKNKTFAPSSILSNIPNINRRHPGE